jgi:hypothetical protein
MIESTYKGRLSIGGITAAMFIVTKRLSLWLSLFFLFTDRLLAQTTYYPPPVAQSVLDLEPYGVYDGNSIGLSFIQSASGNWSSGEENFFTAKINGRSFGESKLGKYRLRRTVTLDVGARYARDSLDYEPWRVSENLFFAEGLLSYIVGWSINPYLSASVRTPITESFYYRGPTRTRTASFWDPGTTQESVGFNYAKVNQKEYLWTRLGIAMKQTSARSQPILAYGWTLTRISGNYYAESGIESVSEGRISLDSTISYIGRLELFGSFKHMDVWTVGSHNQINFQLWKFLYAELSFDLIYNVHQTLKSQWRQGLLLGILKEF